MLEVRKNFERQFENNMTCQLCFSHTETQQAILTCSALNSKPNQTNYNHLFSNNLKVAEKALNEYKKLWNKRQKLLNEK